MSLLLLDAWPHSWASCKYFTFISSSLCCSLQLSWLSKMDSVDVELLCYPSSHPTGLTTNDWRTMFLEVIEHIPFSRRTFHSWFVVEMGEAIRSTSSQIHWSIMLCLNCLESIPRHLSSLKSCIFIINNGLFLYYKFCPMMLLWILLTNPRILLA